MLVTLSSTAPSPAHRLAASLVAVAIGAAALAAIPYGGVTLTAQPGFLPAFSALTFLIEALIATLLIAQAQVQRERAPLRLAAACGFACCVLLLQLAAFPGVVAGGAPLIGGPDTAVWLWALWHGGFPLLVLWFVLAPPARLAPYDSWRVVGGAVLAGAAAGALLVMTRGCLPVLLQAGRFGRLNTLGIGPAVLGLSALAAVAALFKLRLRTPLALWLAVSLLAATLDALLTLHSGGRWTFGWYLARGLSLLTGLTVLVALLSELLAQAGRVGEANAKLEALLRTDSLTGLFNRRAFENVMDTEWRRARREQTALSLAMVDIDLFKGYNDRYGHPAGDACLRKVAAALGRQAQRPADLAARLGGEEFVLLMPATEEDGASAVAERARAAVAALGLRHASSGLGMVTISVGVATFRPTEGDEGPASLVDAADRALYQAKSAGRNTVICAAPRPRLLAVA